MNFRGAASPLALTVALFAQPVFGQDALDRAQPDRAQDSADVREMAIDSIPEVPIIEPDLSFAEQPSGLFVGAVHLDGLEALQRDRFADIVERYMGRTVSPAELRVLVENVAARAREQYPLASAAIAPQNIQAGILTIRVDEGRFDAVRVAGDAAPAVQRALSALATGKPISAQEMERHLLVAGDLDGVSIGNARIEREGDIDVLIVDVDQKKVSGSITLDNAGTRAVGPLEVLAQLRVNRVLASDDSLHLLALNTVPDLSELNYGRLRYTKRLTQSGTDLSVSGSYSRVAPGDYLAALDLDGESWQAGIDLLHPLARARGASLWLRSGLALKRTMQDRADALVRQDRLTIADLGLVGNARLGGGRLTASANVYQGLDIFDATQAGDPLASRGDADGTFTALVLSAGWYGSIAGAFGAEVGVRTQFASDPLLSTEEIGLGGNRFVRGYDYRERSGDEGTMAFGELYYRLRGWGDNPGSLTLYGFADGGLVRNIIGDRGDGTLFSSGGGVRARMGQDIAADFEVAVPLSGERYDTGDDSPRIRFSVTHGF